MSWWSQDRSNVRLAEGPDDLAAMLPGARCVVVVDVLSFSTCVAVAVGAGAEVLPLPWRDDRAAAAATAAGAHLAGPREAAGPSLSPPSLVGLGAGDLLALPSPNGATLTLAAAANGAEVVVGGIRNARATAEGVDRLPVLIVAAGERWPDGRLRPALEDRIGAGLIAAHLYDLGMSLSPEAGAATIVAEDIDLRRALRECASGRELRERGFRADVDWAAEVDAVDVAAVLADGRLVSRARPGAVRG